MSDSQKEHNQTHMLLTMVMIVLETIFSLILKHDRVVALHCKKFVEQNIVRTTRDLPEGKIMKQHHNAVKLVEVPKPEPVIK